MGLGGLFENVFNNHFNIDPNEAFGIGELLKLLSVEAAKISDILNCGYDSLAQKDVYSNEDDPDEETLPEIEKGIEKELIDKNINSILNLLRDTLKKSFERKSSYTSEYHPHSR